MKRFASILIGLNLALLSSLTAQVQDDVKALMRSYTIQDLVTLSDTGGVLMPLQINSVDTNLIMHTSFDGIVLDSKFAEQAKITGNPANRRPEYDVSLKEDTDLTSCRIDMIRSGTGPALRTMRGKMCLVGDTTLPVGAKFKKKNLPIGGIIGLKTLEVIKPVVDFGKGKLLLPFKNTQAGLFSEVMTQHNYEPVIMVRKGGKGPYYIVIKIKRKNYAFQVDLNRRDSSMDKTMSKQLALKVADDKTTLNQGMLGSTPIDEFEFSVTDVDMAGRNMVGYRLAGQVGTDFFKKYKVAIDFAGPLAAIPFGE